MACKAVAIVPVVALAHCHVERSITHLQLYCMDITYSARGTYHSSAKVQAIAYTLSSTGAGNSRCVGVGVARTAYRTAVRITKGAARTVNTRCGTSSVNILANGTLFARVLSTLVLIVAS